MIPTIFTRFRSERQSTPITEDGAFDGRRPYYPIVKSPSELPQSLQRHLGGAFSRSY